MDRGHAREARLARTVRVAGYRRAGVVDGAQFLAVVDDAEEFVVCAAISGGATRVTSGHGTFVLHVILILKEKKRKTFSQKSFYITFMTARRVIDYRCISKYRWMFKSLLLVHYSFIA